MRLAIFLCKMPKIAFENTRILHYICRNTVEEVVKKHKEALLIWRLILSGLMFCFQILVFFVNISIFLITFLAGANWRRVIYQIFRKSSYWYVLDTYHKEYEYGIHVKNSLQWRRVLVYKTPLDCLNQNSQIDCIHEYRKTRFDIY